VLTKLDIYIFIDQRELELNIRKMAHVVAGFPASIMFLVLSSFRASEPQTVSHANLQLECFRCLVWVILGKSKMFPFNIF